MVIEYCKRISIILWWSCHRLPLHTLWHPVNKFSKGCQYTPKLTINFPEVTISPTSYCSCPCYYSVGDMDLGCGGDVVGLRLRPDYTTAQRGISAMPCRSAFFLTPVGNPEKFPTPLMLMKRDFLISKLVYVLYFIWHKYCLAFLDPSWRNWFHISQLASMLAIGIRQPYAKMKVGKSSTCTWIFKVNWNQHSNRMSWQNKGKKIESSWNAKIYNECTRNSVHEQPKRDTLGGFYSKPRGTVQIKSTQISWFSGQSDRRLDLVRGSQKSSKLS
jgi:hypothetical protein